jgi:hypothetical protein
MQHKSFVKQNMDDLKLRENASFVLVMFLKLYQRFSLSSIRYLMHNFFMPNLKEILNGDEQDKNQNMPKLFTLYGLISCFMYFGGQV